LRRSGMKAKAAAKRTGTGTAGGGVAAVDRAFAILDAFEPDGHTLALSEIAVRTGMYKSTILRLADSLLKHGYLQRLEDGRYQIGPRPFSLGAIYQRSLRVGDVVLPLLTRLAKLTGESASFYVLQGTVRVCLHRVDSRHEIRDHVREGDVFPLNRGSGGAVLSAFSGARGERYDAIRADLHYISIGQRDSETAGISAPVFGSGERLAGSLTISGPRSRVTRSMLEQVRAALLRAAAQATGALGGDGRLLEQAAARAAARGSAKVRQAS
jgi:DNA-binding IclR family transcriptional regulator